jgi:hypothetical protein
MQKNPVPEGTRPEGRKADRLFRQLSVKADEARCAAGSPERCGPSISMIALAKLHLGHFEALNY